MALFFYLPFSSFLSFFLVSYFTTLVLFFSIHPRMDSLEKERKEREFKYDIFSGFLFELGEIHELPLTFDDRLFYQLVDFATVYSDGRVVFTFRNGTEITTEM